MIIVETIIYLVAAIGALVITGFSVHMFIGGLVSAELENQVIIVACLIVACVTAYMAWDVVKSRSERK